MEYLGVDNGDRLLFPGLPLLKTKHQTERKYQAHYNGAAIFP